MPDYLYLLESRMSAEQRAALELVQSSAQKEEINIYLTGGAVRDLICGAPIRDLDFTVEGNPARLVHALEKAGAQVLEAGEETRHYELVLPGGVTGSVAAAREEIFKYPGAEPESRWAPIIEDLRRRDFSVNAIGLSLNVASRGLVLDPTNGLADLEKREMRILTMHSFTNQPIRLMRILRYSARLGFPMESRTAEWFALAMEREHYKRMEIADVGREVRALGREENPIAVLKEWGRNGLLGSIHPKLGKRALSFDRMASLLKIRDAMLEQGYRMGLEAPVVAYLFSRLSSRELASTLARLKFRKDEIERITGLDDAADEIIRMLKGRKTKTPQDAYAYLSKTPMEMLAYIQNEISQAKVIGKIKNFLYKWKPLRQQLPVMELESLGVPRGPEFDRVIEAFFQLQLAGRARKPQDRIPVLRKLAGIKAEKEKKPKEAAKPAKGAKTKPADTHKAAAEKAETSAKKPAARAKSEEAPLKAEKAQAKPAARKGKPKKVSKPERARLAKLKSKPRRRK